MSKNIKFLTSLFFVFIVIVIGNCVIVAQTVLTGDWRAERSDKNPDKIQLSLERRSEKGGRNRQSSSYEFKDLQGLSREQTVQNGAVKFSIVREAGTIECEGNFADGKGAGTFRFTSNPQFVAAMKSRGFDFEKQVYSNDERETENRIFAAATLNVTTALADDLLAANFGKLDVDDLFKAAIFKVDSKFMMEMKASGFPNLTMEDLVKARIFKIDAGFVRQVAQMGFDKEPFESLVKMRIFKVTPEFIAEVRSEGLNDVTVEELTKMKIFNINKEFIERAKADGVPLEVEKLVKKRIGTYGR